MIFSLIVSLGGTRPTPVDQHFPYVQNRMSSIESLFMSAPSLFLRSKLRLDPVRRCFPSIYTRRRIVNGDGALLITRHRRRNVTTESRLTSTDSSSFRRNDVDSLANRAPPQQAPDVEKTGNGSNSESQKTHQFDTYRLVLALQSAGYSRPQAVALMKCLRTVLVNGTEFAKSKYLSRGDLENVNPCP